jgi:apolipoprotein N-acyltransferase
MVRAANSGISAVISADGHVNARSPPLQRTVVRSTIQPRTGLTPYARFGALLLWCVIALMVGCCAIVAVTVHRRATAMRMGV